MQNKLAYELERFAQVGWIACEGHRAEEVMGELQRNYPQVRAVHASNQSFFFLPRESEHVLHGLQFALEQHESDVDRLRQLIRQIHSFPRVSPFSDSQDQAICQYDLFCLLDVPSQVVRVFTTHHVHVSEESPLVWVAHEISEDFDVPASADAWDRAATLAGEKMYLLWENAHTRYRLGNLSTDWQGACEFAHRFSQQLEHPDFLQLRGLCASFFPKGELAKHLQRSRSNNF